MVSHIKINKKLLQIAKQYCKGVQYHLKERLITVALFGSVARSEATPFSDIDLLVIAKELPKGRFARMDLLESVDNEIDPLLELLRNQGIFSDICVILKTPEEAEKLSPLYLDMVEDLKILYDKDSFFSNVLDRLKASLKKLGAKRIKQGSYRYWELKPDYQPGEVFEI